MINLFLTFLKIGLFTFGGGYAMIPLIIEETATFGIDSHQLIDFIAISESTPGPFAINIATFIGFETYGFLGAIIATLGVVLPSFIIMLIIAMIINKIRDSKFFKTFISISLPIVCGLILSSALKIGIDNVFSITSFNTIATDFKINVVTLISLSILIVISLLYYFFKKKKLSPFTIIGFSILVGVIANLIIFL